MPTLSQEELNEILGTDYADRVLETPAPPLLTRPVPTSKVTRLASKTTVVASARVSTSISAANYPTQKPHIPTASLVPYLNGLHRPPALGLADAQLRLLEPLSLSQSQIIPDIDDSSHSFVGHPDSQPDLLGQISKPRNDHQVHRAVSNSNCLPINSPSPHVSGHRLLEIDSQARQVGLSGLNQLAQAHNGSRGLRATSTVLPHAELDQNVGDNAINGVDLLLHEQAQTTSHTLTTASTRASHTSRVLAFNKLRNLNAEYSNALKPDRDHENTRVGGSHSIEVVIRNPPISTDDSQALASLSYKKSVPRNKWTEEQRWTLAFMRRTFHNSLKEQLQIFNTMFAEDLADCGLKNGILSPTTLESQWRDMKAGKEGYKYWAFFNINFAHWDRSLTNLQEQIQMVADQHGIILNIRLIEESNVRKHGHCQKKVIRPHEKLMTAEKPGIVPLTVYDLAIPEHSSPPSHISEIENPESAGIHCYKKPSVLPRLVYRFFNLSSAGCNGRQFICGALTVAAAMPPRDPDSEEFKIAFTRHITPDVSFASPFISTFASCLPPVHRAMSNRNAASVAIIELARFVHDSQQTNSENPRYVFSAGELVSKYELKLRGGYTADTEYLVYGTIPSKYVVCLFSADSLWDITKTSPKIDDMLHLPQLASTTPWGLGALKKWLKSNSVSYSRDTGRTVGEMLRLLSAPEMILVDFSTKIAEAWRFKDYQPHKGETFSEADREYISGVQSGYRREQNGEYRNAPPADLATQPNTQTNDFEVVPDSQETRGTKHVLSQDDEVDPFNPYDVDMDGAATDVSHSVHMKVAPWLAGLLDAAQESEEDTQMDVE